MRMTITEKILAAHAGQDAVAPGDLVQVRVDMALANDITAPLAIAVFHELGASQVFDREKVALVPDHFVPNKDIASAEQVKMMEAFADQYKLKNYFKVGDVGIEHVILPEKGLVAPGDLVIGADSHTCTYGAMGAFSTGVGSTDLGAIMATGKTWLKVPETIKVIYKGTLKPWVGGKDLILFTIGRIGVQGARYRTLEFTGPVLKELRMSDRFTMANMAVEAGAKNGIFEPDDAVRDFMKGRTEREGVYWKSDPDARYDEIVEFDLSDLELQVACPHSPENVLPVSSVEKVPLNQVFIGSCTNGSIDDLRMAANFLKGRRVAEKTRLIVIPGSPLIYKQAMQEGILEVLLDAGAAIGPPCCGPCLGGHMGILAGGEKALATTNRNFIGRMGHSKSEVYLAGPAVAAASAVLGRIGSPDEL
ncbi:3-isopropylmalate dehydratase, large subunit [delta proteobacterium NaphS2]|nr:3-isopropylmalate dehydratase, large subunit [delta proteobacterium NaphS2]